MGMSSKPDTRVTVDNWLSADTRKRVRLSTLDKNSEAHITINPPLDEDSVKKIIDAYDGRNIFLRTTASSPRFIEGMLVKDSSYSGCYSIGLPGLDCVADHLEYKEFREMYVMRK